ncbi:MAG: DUF1343 domain-containing protein [Phycisphaerae bacterium]|nr:DUF1343 domain-containing protein [Phycisphaerae bacterium]
MQTRSCSHGSLRVCGLQTFTMILTAMVALVGGASAPAATTIDADRLTPIDQLMAEAIEQGSCPGGVVLVGQRDRIVWRKAYGHRALVPEKVETTLDTIYDMASVTKVVATATSVALLIERGKIGLGDRVSRFIPEFTSHGKDRITVEHLLVHRAGLIPDNSLADYADGPEASMRKIYDLTLFADPGDQFRYSDVGFIMLGELVNRVSGRSLDVFAREEIFLPAGMEHTSFLPPESWRAKCASHEKRGDGYMIGEVHDPRAYALGGVAGHAGLFGTADDLARYCQMILNGGEIDGKRILSPLTVREMTRPRPIGTIDGVRGLGFDIATSYSSARGDLFPRFASFGHTGWTGTSFWIDPTTGVYAIILTNRVHPDGKGNVVNLRAKIATVVASAIDTDAFARPAEGGFVGTAEPAAARKPAARDTQVLTGLDVLVRDGFKPLVGRKVGVITNHTGLTRDGLHIVDVLTECSNLQLVAIFAPEHGFAGALDQKVSDEKHGTTGLTIYSLYGKTRTPTAEMLGGVDTLVFDIQDIGARFYTYIATMGNAMRAAAEHGIRFIVLDRPNPIGGEYVAGPIADADKLGFTAFYPMPVTHGMTIGELARFFNEEMKIGAELEVVCCENWSRDQWYDQTGLLWVNPSPNMRNLTQAILYPGVGLIEATNVSVGRGTDQPFELFGAPWIDARKLAAALNASGLAGVRFAPVAFTPTSSKHKDVLCHGVHVYVTDRETIDSVQVGLTIAWQLRQLFGDQFNYDAVHNLLMNRETLDALRDAKSPDRIGRMWRRDIATFEALRAKHLMYK